MVLAGALVVGLACVAAVAMIGGEAVKTGRVRMELSDRNEFESSPAWYCESARACACVFVAYRCWCCVVLVACMGSLCVHHGAGV